MGNKGLPATKMDHSMCFLRGMGKGREGEPHMRKFTGQPRGSLRIPP
jgi:hypothetical protein